MSRGSGGPPPENFRLLPPKNAFLGIFEQFLIKKNLCFFTFFEMFSCISLLEDLILTISFNRKKHEQQIEIFQVKAWLAAFKARKANLKLLDDREKRKKKNSSIDLRRAFTSASVDRSSKSSASVAASPFPNLSCLVSLRGAWRDQCFPAPFSCFLHETGLESLKITSVCCFSLKCQRKDSKKGEITPPVSWCPWALVYSCDRPYNFSCLSAMSKNGRLRSFFSALGCHLASKSLS